MFEESGKYVLIKHFRRENDENSKALQSQPPVASTSQGITEWNGPDDAIRKENKRNEVIKRSLASIPRHFSFRRSHREDKPTILKMDNVSIKSKLYWPMVLLYYIFFYMGIALIFYICFMIFLLKLPKDIPRVTKYQPNLIYYPNVESYYVSRISWREGNVKEITALVKNINSLLQKFGKHREYGDCNEVNYYGYNSRSPCVFLKVNRIAGFKVNAIEQSKDLPWREHGLKKVIDRLPLSERKDRLWISCKSDAWIHIDYFPTSRSISAKAINSHTKSYSEYLNQSDFEPFIAIRLIDIPIDEPFNVNCKMFAKNIEISYDEGPNVGAVSFDVMLIPE